MFWSRIWRLALWSGIVASATASRRHGRFPTTWVVHLFGNTFLLWLPEIYGGLTALLRLGRRPSASESMPAAGDSLAATGNGLIRALIGDNPRYAAYVTPVALGVIAAHPRIDIYKNEWANEQVFGLGLDTIPHATTALALTQMTYDALATPAVSRRYPSATELAPAISAAVLASATVFYESGEFLIHNRELKQVKNDPSRVAMQWSVPDTVGDVLANITGWLFAVAVHRRRASARVAPGAGLNTQSE